MPAFLSQFGQGGLSILLLAGTAVCWYIAVRAAATALRSRATGILIAGAAPAVAGTAWLSASGRTETAVALALGTAMASATLVLGLVCNITPTEGKPLRDDPSRRLKATLLPVAVTFLIAAFAGVLHLLHGLLLVAEAGIILWLWN